MLLGSNNQIYRPSAFWNNFSIQLHNHMRNWKNTACQVLHISTCCISLGRNRHYPITAFFPVITNIVLKLLLYVQNVMSDIGYKKFLGWKHSIELQDTLWSFSQAVFSSVLVKCVTLELHFLTVIVILLAWRARSSSANWSWAIRAEWLQNKWCTKGNSAPFPGLRIKTWD